MEPSITHLADIPLARNVCNQELRELVVLPTLSTAHVRMLPKATSLFHNHHDITEVYVITQGSGILYCGKQAFAVEKGSYLVIPPLVPHKLTNIGTTPLEHLVCALPLFNPEDVHLVPEHRIEPPVEQFDQEKILVRAQDGASVYELLSKEERQTLGMSLAIGELPPRKTATLHYHILSNEVYYVISGTGRIRLDDKTTDIKQGSIIVIPRYTTHGLENNSSRPLQLLCLASPAYSDEDSYKAHP